MLKGPGLWLAVIALVACGHSTDFLAGMIVLERSESGETSVQLETTDQQRFVLTGSRAAELEAIPGAVVRLDGRSRGRGSPRRFGVQAYQITDAGNGMTPYVGLVRWDFGRILLVEGVGRSPLILTGPTVKQLREHLGAKVWVVGPLVGPEKIGVIEFGILRAPAPHQ